jgi:hypothetical protein
MPFRLHLPCALFGHRARHEAVWNHGFYFAACTRCERDIIRIPGEKWHVPRNARVVWSAAPPASAREAHLSRHRQGPLQPWTELPANSRISGPAARDIRHGAQAETAVVEQRRSAIPDFMADPETPIDVIPGRPMAERRAGPRPVPSRPVRVA